MRVLVVGAAGPLGQALVQEALKQDHEVTEFEQTDALKQGAFDKPLLDQEAVICSMERERTRETVTIFSEGTGNLIRAMQRHNIRKLLCITGVGAGESVGHGGVVHDRLLQPFAFKTVYEDRTRQEKLVQASDRDWMIIRPAHLTDGKARARFSVVENIRGLRAGEISRADVAVWTIERLEINKYLYKAVVLTE